MNILTWTPSESASIDKAFIQSETGLFMKSILLKLMFGRET